MANPPSQPPPGSVVRPRHSSPIRIAALILLGLIVVVGLVVIVTWLAIRPRHLIYAVEDATVHGFNLNGNNHHLNATFRVLLRAYNPNSQVSVYYDSMQAFVLYDEQFVAFETVDPFYQGHRNATRLELTLAAHEAVLDKEVEKDLGVEKGSGEVELEVRIKARVRFKVGRLITRDRTMRVLCYPLAHFSHSNKPFERVYCDVDY